MWKLGKHTLPSEVSGFTMKVLIINYEFPPVGSGAGIASSYLAKHLTKLCNDVLVMTSQFGDLSKIDKIDGYRVYRIPVLRKRIDRCSVLEMVTFIMSGLWYAPNLAKDFKPDMIYAYFGIPSGPIALWLKILYGIPYIVFLRGGDVPGFQKNELHFYHFLLTPLIKLIWEKAYKIIAINKGFKDKVRELTGKAKVVTIPNGIDKTLFFKNPCQNNAAQIRIITVGRLATQKRFDILIDAIKKLIENGCTRSFIVEIVGEGPKKNMLRRQVNSLRLSNYIRFLGRIDRNEIADKYRSSDVFALTSTYEGMSNAMLEALACGLPVVASDLPSNREIVKDGNNGFLFPPENSEILAERLNLLIKDDILRDKMSKMAVETSVKFDWVEIARKIHSL